MSALTQVHIDANGSPVGDCWRTAIACLLDLDDPTEAPHFIQEQYDAVGPDASSLIWWERTVRFVESLRPGMTLLCREPVFPVYVYPDVAPRTVVATGPSPRGDFMHAVLVDSATGGLAWDPHPSRAGLAGPPVEIAVLSDKATS